VRSAFAFLTVLPGTRQPDHRSLRWFPVVGAVVGLALGGLWWVTAKAWPLPVAAVIVVLADLMLTGMLHVDGLADSADGLLPHMTVERRLEVMHEPTVGAFGVAVVFVVLLARWAVFATLRPAPLLVAALWCVSRTAMGATINRQPYARAGVGVGAGAGAGAGLASAFQGARLPTLLVGLAVAASAAVACVWAVPAGPVAVGASVVAFVGVAAFAQRRIGGYTGDVLGAAGIIGETVGLLVAAAKW
jgi:adenosylcobinamide-GDP ribazoletransferase